MRALTRQQAIETAFAFEGSDGASTPPPMAAILIPAATGFNRIRRPGYLHGKLEPGSARHALLLGMSRVAEADSAQKIERGMLAGNVCTHNAPRSDVAGVDCSAFVSAAWGLSTHFTTAAIPAITRRLENPWDLQPGDALNKPGSHVMLFLRFTPDRKAEVMEVSPAAATDGSAAMFIRWPRCWRAATRRCAIAPWRMPRRQTPARPQPAQQIKAARPIATQRMFVPATRKRTATRHHKKHSARN